jgi:LuxR family transcriptional regulator, maltose regulon positive regulatory protein
MIGEFVAQGNTQTFMAMVCEVIAGEVLAERGDLTEARRWLRAGLTRLAAMPDAGILRPRLLRLQDLLEQRQLLEPLTPAERRVLELLPTELSLKEIASHLWVSHETVRTHVKDIYRKLEVHSRSGAVARARDLGLFMPT